MAMTSFDDYLWLFRKAPTMATSIGEDGRYLDVNDAFIDRVGYSREEMIGKRPTDFVTAESAKRIEVEFLPLLRRSGKLENKPITLLTKTGEMVSCLANSLVEHDPDGAFIRTVALYTELAENALRSTLVENARLREELERERDYLREEVNVALNFGRIVGKSLALQHMLAQVEVVAGTSANVLVLGESGVCKELVAREIHARSPRADAPLVKVNCASVPQELFESEFFGHVCGAFTGAHKDRVGRFQLADGGTLFLDEVGEIPIELQGKLLRVLQENEFERVGDDITQSVDVRVVAATNRNLKELVLNGEFREDLLYRLSVFPIEVPPLIKRKEDVILSNGTVGSRSEETVFTERQMKTMQRHNIELALKASNWRVSGDHGAAELLGVKPTTLADRMKTFGIKKPS